jgi:hypothetical protein
MSDRTWGSDDWLAEREQHRADEDAERRHEATHEYAEPDCGFCEAAMRDAEQDFANDEEENE